MSRIKIVRLFAACNISFQIIMIVVFSLLGGAHVIAQVDLNRGLVAHYPLSGHAQDVSGNENNGTVMGAVPIADRFGNTSGAYFFDGIDDYIVLSNNQNMQPGFPVTISAWVWKEIDKPQSIFRNNYQENIYSGVWLNIPVSGKVEVGYGDGGAPGPASRRSKLGDTKLENGKWYHILGIIRGTRDMEIYINGRNDCGSYSGTGGPLVYTSNPGSIGVTDDHAASSDELAFFNGRIDEVRLYDRALEPEEIQALADYIPPQINISADTTICAGESVQLEVSGGGTYRWSPAAGLSCMNCPNPIASPESSTTYQVVLNPYTCSSDTLSVTIHLDFSCILKCEELGLVANFALERNDLELTLTNQSVGGTYSGQINWGDSINSSMDSSTTTFNHAFSDEGTYLICLRIWDTLTNKEICIDSFCQEVTLFIPCGDTLFIPNVFTPNQDGINDNFILKYTCPIEDYHLQIFNRWGKLVYESHDISAGWNGMMEGKHAKTGVYYWILKYVDRNGSHYRKGNLSLFR